MKTFPPPVGAYLSPHEPTPSVSSPVAFVRWIIRDQGGLMWLGLASALVWMLPTVAGPWLLGRVIDDGILARDPGAGARWLILLALVTIGGALNGVLYHTIIVQQWLVAHMGVVKLVTHKALHLGHVLPRRVPTGEVLSVASSDSGQFGAQTEITVRTLSQIIAYAAIAVIVMNMSPTLGWSVLLSAPLVLLVAWPLMRPMQRWQRVERGRDSDLTSKAVDIVAGLRILRGIGGEHAFGDGYAEQSQRVRAAGMRAGLWQAGVDAAGILLSGLVLAGLMWVGTGQVTEGRLTVGALVTLLGYGLATLAPMRTFFQFVQKTTRSLVSGAKTIDLLDTAPPWDDRGAGRAAPPADSTLVDEQSGFTVRPGRLTALVGGVPDDTAAVADRLGRYLGIEHGSDEDDDIEELSGRRARQARRDRSRHRRAQAEADAARAARPWGVRWGDIDLRDVPLTAIRERIVVSDTNAALFAGTLQSAVDPHRRLTRERAEAALHAAAAEDVYDALPGGWQGTIDERGRGLSGGQRQRVVLARALALDPEVLVLVEPTSAVDAHTEARIAERLARLRRGRTTVIATASPLLLHQSDEVALMVDGIVVAVGTHDDLMDHEPRYRAVVLRGDDDSAPESSPATRQEVGV